MNQSELEANTCNWRQVAIGFGFTSDWSRKWRDIFLTNQSEVKQNQSKTRIAFYTQMKTAL